MISQIKGRQAPTPATKKEFLCHITPPCTATIRHRPMARRCMIPITATTATTVLNTTKRPSPLPLP